MNRFLLILNIAAAGSILATNSAGLLTAISPYGHPEAAHPPLPRPTAEAAARPGGPERPVDSLAAKADPKLRLASVETGAVE
jgi:hypothetical protein